MQIYIISNKNGDLLDIAIDNEIDLMSGLYDNFVSRLAEIKTLEECYEFDIIENEKDKMYGLSFISPRDSYNNNSERYDCLLWQTRLQLQPGQSYGEACEFMPESNAKSCYSYASDTEDAVSKHLDFWMWNSKSLEDSCSRRVYCLTNAELTMLLNKGFSDDRILVELVSE